MEKLQSLTERVHLREIFFEAQTFPAQNEIHIQLKHSLGKLGESLVHGQVKSQRLAKHPWITCSWNGETHCRAVLATLELKAEQNSILTASLPKVKTQ